MATAHVVPSPVEKETTFDYTVIDPFVPDEGLITRPDAPGSGVSLAKDVLRGVTRT